MTTRDRGSAGRLLRAIRDCELFHMETAIAGFATQPLGVRTSKNGPEDMKPPLGGAGGGGVEAIGRVEHSAEVQERVLALSDHKRIASLQAVLNTIAKAYDAPHDEEGEGGASWNLVATVATAAISQAMRDCTASRANCCVWGRQAQKLHTLLYGMIRREHVASRRHVVRTLLLERLQPTADKQSQLTACLTLFELLLRHRRDLTVLEPGGQSLRLLGDRSDVYLEALLGLIERGCISVPGSNRIKPSKLALIALETLLLLCGDVAAHFMTSEGTERRRSITDSKTLQRMVEAMNTGLQTLRQWHLHSKRRQFFRYALDHLASYAAVCSFLLPNGTSTASRSDETVAALDALCWHWQATAPLLCTRSDVSIRIQKNRSVKMLAHVLEVWGPQALSIRVRTGTATCEVLYAQLRYVSLLLSLISGEKELSGALESFPAELRANLVLLLAQGLSLAIGEGNGPAVRFILKVLRALLLDYKTLKLLNVEEEQALLSQLLRSVGLGDQQIHTELEFFVADFIINRELSTTELVKQMCESHAQRVQRSVSLVRTFLYRLGGAATRTPLHQLWRRQLTPAVLGLLAHESSLVRRLALSCLPSLDRVSCLLGLCAADESRLDDSVATSALGFLFATSMGATLEAMASFFIDACRFSDAWDQLDSAEVPRSPDGWSSYAALLKEASEGAASGLDGEKPRHERLLSLCFGVSGWSTHIHSTDAHVAVLSVLLGKILGSPRDMLLFRMLREFVATGWMDGAVLKQVLKRLVAHMMNQQRLTEEFLDDDSALSASRIETLLFARLAPMLVLRLVPREAFDPLCTNTLLCGREDLGHLEAYVEQQRQLHELADQVEEGDTTITHLFHLLARSIVDPLEFKEVKMLATEGLSKFPPRRVLPFVFAYLTAFVREEIVQLPALFSGEQNFPFAMSEETIPESCGLVAAKLMVYYLNRVITEDAQVYRDVDIIAATLVMLVQILRIPCAQGPNVAVDQSLLADLQRGCIDCMALVLSKLAAGGCDRDAPIRSQILSTNASSLLNLLLRWMFDDVSDVDDDQQSEELEAIGPHTQRLLERVWSEAQCGALPLQVRVCCCNVLLSTISRSEDAVLASWKAQGVITRVATATARCLEEDVAAGGLQILFAFVYKAGAMLYMEDEGDLRLARSCFEVTLARLESTCSENVAMSGLKVVGALLGKLPAFLGTLQPSELQRLIDRCLISLRGRRVSVAVSELAQSLLQAITPL